ncbi:MAG: AbrB/MazE/SpoVT family DNA-binding domain-containing protein [Caulobacterales bacterium]
MTVSDKIRGLDAAGYPRAEIARLLGKRYQHVRNVLEADKLSRREARNGVAERSGKFTGPRQPEREVEDRGGGAYRLVVRDDGSVVLPPAVRDAFGVQERGVVMARMEGDEFKLIGAATACRRIDELMRPFRWAGGPLASEELIAERRAEAVRESDG